LTASLMALIPVLMIFFLTVFPWTTF